MEGAVRALQSRPGTSARTMVPEARTQPGLQGSGEGYWVPDLNEGGGPHVTVIGAGLVGLATAAALRRAGRAVTVVDAAEAVGSGASRGNGCQLSYGYVAPLAQPGLLAELPGLLLRPDAPLRIRPRLDLAQWRWMFGFLAACRESVATRTTAELLKLGLLSRIETERWIASSDAQTLAFARHGKLVLTPSVDAFESAARQVKLQAVLGGPAQWLIGQGECLAIEPALKRFNGPIAGAVYTPDECVVDSLALCRDLEHQLRERGVEFRFHTRVIDFERRGSRVTRIATSNGTQAVEQVVLANGSRAARLARRLSLHLPVQPLKGYSITAAITDEASAPTVSITDAQNKVVYARLGNRLRIAGIAEICGDDPTLEPRRISQLIRHAREAFGHCLNLDAPQAWTGMRPATPTSMPLIGPALGLDNVVLNVGHGALGLTLAFGSARRVAELLTAQPTS